MRSGKLSSDGEPVQLETERLILRALQLDDADDVFEYANDEEWVRFLNKQVPFPYSREDSATYVSDAVGRSWERGPQFAIVIEGKVRGAVALEVQAQDRAAELGYGLARSAWGRGLAVEASAAAINWTFKNYDVLKVFARADARNDRSIRVLEKLGFKQEGLLRQQRFARDGQTDEVFYGALREEWVAAHPVG